MARACARASGKRANTCSMRAACAPGRLAADLQVLAHRQGGEDVVSPAARRRGRAGDLARRQAGDARPPRAIAPCCGPQQPGDGLQQVDLPAPFGPMMATISPSSTSRSTPFRISSARRSRRRRRWPRAGIRPRLLADPYRLPARADRRRSRRTCPRPAAALPPSRSRVAQPRDHVHVVLDQQEVMPSAASARRCSRDLARPASD